MEHIEPNSLSILKALYRRYRECPADPGVMTITPDAHERMPWHTAVQELLDQQHVVQAFRSADSYPLTITRTGCRYIESNGIDVDTTDTTGGQAPVHSPARPAVGGSTHQMSLEGDLRRILHQKPNSVVWVVGAGVPVGALRGTPAEPYASWFGLLQSGLQRIHALGKINAAQLTMYEGLLSVDDTSWVLVAEKITQALGEGEFELWLRETVGTFHQNLADRTVLDALAMHQQRGCLLATTNYDHLLEKVTGLQAVTWLNPSHVEAALRGDEAQILHLHGVWRQAESIVLGIRSYDDVVRNEHARAVLTTLRISHTFVFVGCGAGLRDPNIGSFLKSAAHARSLYRHFRLCRNSELDELRREHPDEQRIFPLPYGNDHADLAPFLRSLLPASGGTSLDPADRTVPRQLSPRGDRLREIASREISDQGISADDVIFLQSKIPEPVRAEFWSYRKRLSAKDFLKAVAVLASTLE